MDITLCDLCGNPIKKNKYFHIVAQYKDNLNSQVADVDTNYRGMFVKEMTRDICENCHSILISIFNHRLNFMLELADRCKQTYALPTKEPPKRKENNLSK